LIKIRLNHAKRTQRVVLASYRRTSLPQKEPKVAAGRVKWDRKLAHSFTVYFLGIASLPVYEQSLCVEFKTIIGPWSATGLRRSGINARDAA